MAQGQISILLQHIRQLIGASSAGDLSDRQLLEQFAVQKNQAAFAELVRRHGPLVLGVCQRVLHNTHDAEDAFQATFLVIARKAASTRWHELVSNWLYEVAYRTALTARRGALRRRARERQAGEMQPGNHATEAGDQELRGVLDSELHRLPVRYRAPLLLCYLEGKTTEEAAEHLGCPTGTVKSRLARGRDLLRDRLTRRGLALSAAALAEALAQSATMASVSSQLVAVTTETAWLFASEKAEAVGGTAGPVVTLAEGVMQAMWISKLKVFALLFLVVGLVGTGLGGLAFSSMARGTALVPAPANPEAAREPEGGKPVNGLKLTLSADKTETVMKADGSNAEPVKLKLTFTNVSDKPIKLPMYLPRTRFAVTSTDPKMLRTQGAVEYSPAAGADAPVIQPGASWSWSKTDIRFPGWLEGGNATRFEYIAQKEGECRIRCSYASGNNEEAGNWIGTLDSNELVVRVLPTGGKEVNGLKLTLSADKTETVMKADGSNAEPVKLKLTFTNVSDKPIKLDMGWFPVYATVTATDPTSLSKQVVSPGLLPRKAQATDFVTIKPGDTWIWPRDQQFPGSYLPIENIGGAMYTVLKPGDFRIQYTYRNLKAFNDPLAAGSWTGTVASNELALKVLPVPLK